MIYKVVMLVSPQYKKPSTLLALLQTWLMWEVHLRLLEIITPKYMNHCTWSRFNPCRVSGNENILLMCSRVWLSRHIHLNTILLMCSHAWLSRHIHLNTCLNSWARTRATRCLPWRLLTKMLWRFVGAWTCSTKYALALLSLTASLNRKHWLPNPGRWLKVCKHC